jgi:hypothetical protein
MGKLYLISIFFVVGLKIENGLFVVFALEVLEELGVYGSLFEETLVLDLVFIFGLSVLLDKIFSLRELI